MYVCSNVQIDRQTERNAVLSVFAGLLNSGIFAARYHDGYRAFLCL